MLTPSSPRPAGMAYEPHYLLAKFLPVLRNATDD